MKFFTKIRIKIFTICSIVAICIFIIPIKVNVFGYASVSVLDYDGARLANRSVNRSYEYDLYIPGKMIEEKKITDENGSVFFPQADITVFLGVYVFRNILYQLTDPCPCCLQQLYIGVDRDVANKEIFYKTVDGNSFTFVRVKEWKREERISIESIDQSRFDLDARRLLVLGNKSWVHPDFLGELKYLQPKTVSVNNGVINIGLGGKRHFICILNKTLFDKKYSGGRYAPTKVVGLYEDSILWE